MVRRLESKLRQLRTKLQSRLLPRPALQPAGAGMPPIDCWAFAEEQAGKPVPEKPKAAPKPKPPVEPVPIQAAGVPSGPRWVKPALIGGGITVGVVGLACVFFFVLLPMFGGGLPSWTGVYVPRDVVSVRFTNYKAAVDADVRDPDDVEDAAERAARGAGAADVKGQEIEALFAARGEKATVTVIRTLEDLELDDVIGNYADADVEEEGDFEYVKMAGGRYALEADPRTFAITSGQEAKAEMEDLIERIEKSEREEFPEDFQTVLDYVSSEHSFSAELSTDRNTKWLSRGSGTTIGSSFRNKSITVYEDERDAEDEYDDQMDRFKDELEKLEEAVEDADDRDRDLVKAYKVYQEALNGEPQRSGAVLRSSGSVSVSSLRDLLDLDSDDDWKKIQEELGDARTIYNELTRRDDRDRDRD